MVVFGGMLGTGHASAELWSLSWDTWQWTLLDAGLGGEAGACNPSPRVGHCMCAAPGSAEGQTLLVFGGGDGVRGFGNLLSLRLPRKDAGGTMESALYGSSVEWRELAPEGGGLRPLEGSTLAAAWVGGGTAGGVPMALVCGGRSAETRTERYSTELYGWALAEGSGFSEGTGQPDTVLSASSTALDFEGLPAPVDLVEDVEDSSAMEDEAGLVVDPTNLRQVSAAVAAILAPSRSVQTHVFGWLGLLSA